MNLFIKYMNFLMVGYNSHIPHLLLSFIDNKSLPNAFRITKQEVIPNPVSPCPPRPKNFSTFLQSLRSIWTIHCLANGFDCTIQICKSYQYALNILKKKTEKKHKKTVKWRDWKTQRKLKSVTIMSCTWDETVAHSTTLNHQRIQDNESMYINEESLPPQCDHGPQHISAETWPVFQLLRT